MNTYHIACFDKSGQMQHYSVPEEICIYIKQLENYIKYPELSHLKEIYGFRFTNAPMAE